MRSTKAATERSSDKNSYTTQARADRAQVASGAPPSAGALGQRATREFRARSAPLFTRDAGSGAAIVLLHAFPLNSRMWEPQLEALAAEFRLIAPDLPGFGLSWTPTDAPSLEDYAREVLATLDLLEVKDLFVVGLSMGGYLAFRLIEPLGDRLRGLVLADTQPGPDGEKAATARHELAAEVEANGVGVVESELLPRLIGDTTLGLRADVVERVRSIIAENSVAGVAGALRALAGRPDSTPVLSRIRCPVLCLVGEEDRVTTPEVVTEMAARIAEAHTHVLPGAGHLTNLEAPAAFNAVMTDFLRGCHARSDRSGTREAFSPRS
jgi:pimeloyl-ACP methyl ester carboxylesterase